MPSNTQQLQSGSITQTLPSQFTGGLEFLLNQAQGLADAPLTPDLSQQTLGAIGNLGQINPLTQDFFQSTLAGDPTRFNVAANLDDPSLRAAAGFAAESAAGRVGDVFTAAGRTGSPANALAISRGVGQAVSPFTFSAIQNAENRNFQATQAALARQETAAGQLQNLTDRQTQGQLFGGQLLDEQQRSLLSDPFERLRQLSSPILGAASAAPRSQTTTSPFTTNPFLQGIGGATSILGLGNALFPSGGGVGNAALGALGLGGAGTGATSALGLGGAGTAGLGALGLGGAGALGGGLSIAGGGAAGTGGLTGVTGLGSSLGVGTGAAGGALTPGAVSISPLGAAGTSGAVGTGGATGLAGFGSSGSFAGLGGAAALALPLALGAFGFPSGAANIAALKKAKEDAALAKVLPDIQAQIPAGLTQEEFNASRIPPQPPVVRAQQEVFSNDEGDKDDQIDQLAQFNRSPAGQAQLKAFYAANPLWYNPDGSRTDYAGPFAPPLSQQRATAEATF